MRGKMLYPTSRLLCPSFQYHISVIDNEHTIFLICYISIYTQNTVDLYT